MESERSTDTNKKIKNQILDSRFGPKPETVWHKTAKNYLSAWFQKFEEALELEEE